VVTACRVVIDERCRNLRCEVGPLAWVVVEELGLSANAIGTDGRYWCPESVRGLSDGLGVGRTAVGTALRSLASIGVVSRGSGQRVGAASSVLVAIGSRPSRHDRGWRSGGRRDRSPSHRGRWEQWGRTDLAVRDWSVGWSGGFQRQPRSISARRGAQPTPRAGSHGQGGSAPGSLPRLPRSPSAPFALVQGPARGCLEAVRGGPGMCRPRSTTPAPCTEC
jgi:hypothetical protein